MWPFTNRSQGSRGVISKLEGRIFQLEEDYAQLRGAHERLRGAFYARQGKDSPPQPETKADVLRAAGYRPGQPFNHR